MCKFCMIMWPLSANHNAFFSKLPMIPRWVHFLAQFTRMIYNNIIGLNTSNILNVVIQARQANFYLETFGQ